MGSVNPAFVKFEKVDVFVGISGVAVEEAVDFGSGITLTPVYAHLFAEFMMAFSPPPSPDTHHPGPWISAKGGFHFDISGQLFVPQEAGTTLGSSAEVMGTILSLLRIWVNPAITAVVLSDTAFSEATSKSASRPRFFPMEVSPRWFSLSSSTEAVTLESAQWVMDNWRMAHQLRQANPEFLFALDALSKGQFIQNSALALVSLWAALEALFSHSTSEVTFRLSTLIASFLEPPGPRRIERQKVVAKLYGKRSHAAHGLPKHQGDDLLLTFVILRDVIIRIIDRGAVPTKEELHQMLLGADMR